MDAVLYAEYRDRTRIMTDAPLRKSPLFGRFTLQHFVACLLIAYVCYASAIILPAFNADDIIQTQSVSGDYMTFAQQGRWGYFLIYGYLFDANPAGPFALMAGVAILCGAGVVAARTIGASTALSYGSFVLITAVSIYFAICFSFDSTRIAYPLSVAVAALAVHGMLSRRWIAGALLFALAPALFPASVQVGLTIILAASLATLLSERRVAPALRKAVIGAAGVVCGLALYLVLTKLSPFWTGVPLSPRSSVDILGALAEYGRFWKILTGHAVPSGDDISHFNLLMQLSIWALIALLVAVVVSLASSGGGLALTLFAALLAIGLFVTPFCLAFASPIDDFGPRALIAYSITHASIAVLAIETARRWRLSFALVPAVVAGCLVLGTSVAISQNAFDEYLTSRNDFLATNRIMARVEEAAAEAGLSMQGPIPLVVRYEKPFSLASTGVPSTSRATLWSQEWIFRHIDPRIAPITGARREDILRAAGERPEWPRSGSVFVIDGTVVVNIN